MQAGNTAAFEPLVDAHLDHIRALTALKLPLAHFVDELAHETFVFAFRNIAGFTAGTAFRSWLRAIATNLIRAELQRYARAQANQLGYTRARLLETDLLATTPAAPLFHTARPSVHCVPMSVYVRLQMKSPARLVPQCATLSASKAAGPGHVPGAGADRDFGLEQGAGFGAAAAAQRMRHVSRGQQAVQRGGADLAQPFPLAGGELAMVALVVAQPQRQGRGQALAAGLFGGRPDRAHDRLDKGVAQLGARVRASAGRGQRVPQEPEAYLRL